VLHQHRPRADFVNQAYPGLPDSTRANAPRGTAVALA
jgi:hypothetical protein